MIMKNSILSKPKTFCQKNTNKNLKICFLFATILVACSIFFIVVFYNRPIYIQNSNDIQEVVLKYWDHINKSEFEKANNLLLSSNQNNLYIELIKKQMKDNKIKSILLEKINPTLIDNDMAIISYVINSNVLVDDKEMSFKELGFFLLKKENNQWKILSPFDVTENNSDYINTLYEKYSDFLISNKEDSKNNLDILESQSKFNKQLQKVP